MSYEFKEADWKEFRKCLPEWQERYMDKLNREFLPALFHKNTPNQNIPQSKYLQAIRHNNIDFFQLHAISDVSLRCFLFRMDRCGVPDNNGVCRHIKIYKGIRTDHYIVTDLNFSCDCGVYSDKHTISERRHTFSLPSVFLTDRTSLMKITVISDDDTITNCNVVRMSEIKPFSDPCARGNLQTIFSAVPIKLPLSEESHPFTCLAPKHHISNLVCADDHRDAFQACPILISGHTIIIKFARLFHSFTPICLVR